MTVQELIDELARHPKHMRVVTNSRDGHPMWADYVELSKSGFENVVAIVVLSDRELGE